MQAREILRMELDVTEEPQPPVWPDGVAMRTYHDDDAPAVHALMVEAFAANAEVVLPFDRWVPWMTGDPGFDPGVWFLAEAGAELCGACLCWAEGWVKDVGVRPAWRGRGLGEALLREAFGEFHRRGLATVGLKVDSDNPTGAVRLYERVGMLPDRRYVMFSRAAQPVSGTQYSARQLSRGRPGAGAPPARRRAGGGPRSHRAASPPLRPPPCRCPS